MSSRDKVDRLTTQGAQKIADAVLIRRTMPPWWQIRKRRAAWARYRELMDEAKNLCERARDTQRSRVGRR